MKQDSNQARLFQACSLIFIICLTGPLYSQETEIPASVAKKVVEGIYVHNCWGANLTILSGEDGLLIVDTGYPAKAAFTDSIIHATFGKPVRYIVNTHYNYDHVGANHMFAKRGAVLVAHEKIRPRLKTEWNVPEIAGLKYPVIPPFPEEFLPDISFNDSITIYMNSEVISCRHMPEAHSDCDVVIHFKKANVIQTGDLFLSNSFPPLEYPIESYLAAVDEIINSCDEQTIVIPGHGPVSDRKGLLAYRKRLSKGAQRIRKLKSEGKTLDEVIAADPLQGLLEGKHYVPDPVFIYCVYNEGIEYR